ncbi:MAG TPA: hypothetical protein VGM18_15400 [Candidatus Sulfotelmatobacter sp.]|jgi:hypothetical protein
MAPYEPKIDSREFEVANAEQYPNAWSGESRADITEIAFRLWGADRSRGNALTWHTENALVYLIADLVGASGGRIAEDGPTIMVAQFNSPGQALVSAKRIQTSILEFVACRPGERIGTAVFMYKPRSSELTGYSTELVQLALEKALPGQILLAESMCDRLRDLAGAGFRPITEATGDGQSRLVELMWTNSERLAQLQSSAGDEDRPVEPVGGSGTPLGATRIVHSPITRREPLNEIVPPVVGTGNLMVKGIGGATSQRTGQAPNSTHDRAPVFERFAESPSRAFTDGLDEFRDRPLFTRNRIILGVLALVLVAAVVAVLFRPTQVTKRPTQPVEPHQDQIVGAESSGKPASVGTESPDNNAQPEAVTVKPKAKESPAAPQQQTSKKSTDNHKSKKENPDEPAAPPSEVGGYSQKDIPFLLTTAQADLGAGRYDEAKLKFKKVLALQPSNQEAKEGLHRLELFSRDQQ